MRRDVVAFVKVRNDEIGNRQRERLCYIDYSAYSLHFENDHFFDYIKILQTLERTLTNKDVRYELEIVNENEKKILVDLHIHTLSSDGEFTANEIISEIASLEGEKIISFTGHDSVDAYFDINSNILEKCNINIIPGVELSCIYNGVYRDVLGYGVAINELKEILDKIYVKELNIERQSKTLQNFKDKVRKENLIFDEDVKISTGNKSEAYGLMIKSIREHEENLIRYPEFKDHFYRSHFSNPKSKWYVDETYGIPQLDEVIDIIHKVGGKAFLAHPYDYPLEKEELNIFINDAIKKGIDGLEVDHSNNKDGYRERLLMFVNDFKLLQSGGSDFHGESKKKGIKLFFGKGNLIVKYANVKKWIENIKKFN